MKISGKKTFLTIAISALLLIPVPSLAGEAVFNGAEAPAKGIGEMLKENPLPPGENIKSTLIHRGEGMSVHLIQIRGAERPHIHRDHDLFVSLERGRGRLHLGGMTMELREGDMAFIPRGAVHYFENTGEEAAAGVGVFAPSYDGADNIPVQEE